jgi:hypothetical protein
MKIGKQPVKKQRADALAPVLPADEELTQIKRGIRYSDQGIAKIS